MTGLEIALRHAFNERDEEIARLRAEIAALTADRDDWRYQSRQRDLWVEELNAEIAALTERAQEHESMGRVLRGDIGKLTEQRDGAIAERNETRDRTYGRIRELREDRDRAIRDLRDATYMLSEARYWIIKSGVPHPGAIHERIAPVEIRCKDTLAALDTPSSPSLPESPIDG